MNIGIIGIGYWGPNIVRNFATNPRVDNIVCADLREEALQKIKGVFPAVEITTDVDAVLTNPELDIIAVVTPVDTHYDLALKALQNGKHVLIEKPMTTTSEQAEKLIALADANKLSLHVDHTFIYTGAVRKMRDIIQSGELGAIRYYDSVRVNLGLFQHDINVIWDLAPHDISIMSYLLEEKPISVQATGARTPESDVEYVGYLTLNFASGVIAHFHANWLSPVKLRQTLIGGTSKMIVYDDNEPSEKIKVYDKGIEVTSREGAYKQMIQYRTGDMWAPKLDNLEALSFEINHFLDCIEKGIPSDTDGRAGLDVVRVLEASSRSIQENGKPIPIG
ncbi:MAG: Gfo/Idh/MocA family oxidoreductase [Candidatus Delongbacteria bacterium]|nr:Gfo/Idh/MocA family oxidoreductase [bacterium]MBL7033112.1 Gfo/Idh/MocA family oxidoreductase [Candidatus Delongbacteria bacterium]